MTVRFNFQVNAEADDGWCHFEMFDDGRLIIKVEGNADVVSTAMAAWWTKHGAAYIRDRVGPPRPVQNYLHPIGGKI